MDIACPNCAATYRVPDALLATGNALRCAACGHAWIPEPPVLAPALTPAGPRELPASEPPLPIEAPPLPIEAPPEPPDAEPEEAPPSKEAGRRPPPVAARSDITLEMPPPTRVGPPHLAVRRLPEAPPRREHRRMALPLAWIVSIAAVVAFLVALVIYRSQIASVWPPFARLAGLAGP